MNKTTLTLCDNEEEYRAYQQLLGCISNVKAADKTVRVIDTVHKTETKKEETGPDLMLGFF